MEVFYKSTWVLIHVMLFRAWDPFSWNIVLGELLNNFPWEVLYLSSPEKDYNYCPWWTFNQLSFWSLRSIIPESFVLVVLGKLYNYCPRGAEIARTNRCIVGAGKLRKSIPKKWQVRIHFPTSDFMLPFVIYLHPFYTLSSHRAPIGFE